MKLRNTHTDHVTRIPTLYGRPQLSYSVQNLIRRLPQFQHGGYYGNQPEVGWDTLYEKASLSHQSFEIEVVRSVGMLTEHTSHFLQFEIVN